MVGKNQASVLKYCLLDLGFMLELSALLQKTQIKQKIMSKCFNLCVFFIFNLISWSEGKQHKISALSEHSYRICTYALPTWRWARWNSWANNIIALDWASLQRLQRQQKVNNSGGKQGSAWKWGVGRSEATLWKQPAAQQLFYNFPHKLPLVRRVLCHF